MLSEELNVDGFNPFSKTPRAKYIEKEGWKLICLYDQKGNLHNVLDGSFFGDGEKVAMGKWMQQIMGKYTDSYGDTLEIGHEIIYEKGVARAEYKNIAFNGTVTGVLKISGLTDLATSKVRGRLCRHSMVLLSTRWNRTNTACSNARTRRRR